MPYRGRKNPSHSEYPDSNDQRWMSQQQQYYNHNTPHGRGRGWTNHTSYMSWTEFNSSNFSRWPIPQYHPNSHHRAEESFYQFPQRFPMYNSAIPHYPEHSLAHEPTRGNYHEPRELTSSQQQSSSIRQSHPSQTRTPSVSVDSQIAKGTRVIGTESTIQEPTSSNKPAVSNPQNTVPATQKQPIVTSASSTFMPPNDDLRNKVKASLKQIAANKDGAPSSKTNSSDECASPSSRQQGESRKQINRVGSSATLSPSTSSSPRAVARPYSMPQRRRSQSGASTSAGDGSTNSPNGIGFTHRTQSEITSASDQVISSIEKSIKSFQVFSNFC